MGTLGKDDLEFLVERVLERLRRPRVGLVACAPLPPLPGTDRFEWIAYARGADGALEGWQDLNVVRAAIGPLAAVLGTGGPAEGEKAPILN